MITKLNKTESTQRFLEIKKHPERQTKKLRQRETKRERQTDRQREARWDDGHCRRVFFSKIKRVRVLEKERMCMRKRDREREKD